MEYVVVIEKADNNYSAYVPDLPGCVATGATRAEAAREIRAAILFHLDGLREDGQPVPKPSSTVRWMSAIATKRSRPRARAKAGSAVPRADAQSSRRSHWENLNGSRLG